MMKFFMVTTFTIFLSASPFSFVLALTFLVFLCSIMATHSSIPSLYSSMFMWDTLSWVLIILTIWVIMLMILTSSKIYSLGLNSQLFTLSVATLLIILVWSFSMTDTILFYILFEASLIPTFLLIMGWGYQPERLQAGVYMLMYTVFASLPLLLSILIWNSSAGSMNFLLPLLMSKDMSLSSLWGLMTITAFLVKLPIYLVHLWLPKAHVEAPVAGSMILAGILLKLGGYGLMRLVPAVAQSLGSILSIIMIWSVIGGSVIASLCTIQTDMKHLIALSSVAHMSLVVGGILTMTTWGFSSSLLIMVGHGFCSSGLFCIANMAYERTHSRSLKLTKGMLVSMPSLTLWWFILSAANMAAPPSLNLLGEMYGILSLFSWSFYLLIPLAWLTFFAAAYSLYLYCSTQHGKPSTLSLAISSSSPREILILMLHSLPLFTLILKISLFS